jgi:hypothetical protein
MAFQVHLELLEIERINKNDAAIERTKGALRALGNKMGLAEPEIESRIENGIFGGLDAL